ncbi:MAG: hypothetical protein SH809_21260 [Rhodothermales bacterium]|nr:hypothetical protein [Rhodothermales bacterium]
MTTSIQPFAITAILAGAMLAAATPALGQARLDFSQVTRPVVEVQDPQLVAFLLDALIILTEGETTSLEVIDITRNGFGPDDVVVVHPSMETHKLPPVLPLDVQDLMNGWELEANTQYDGANDRASVYDPERDPELRTSRQKAERAVLYDLLRSLERNYRDAPLSILFERNEEAFTFQMWDYNEDALAYTPPPPAQPDTVNAYDMLFVLRQDSLIIADTVLYDLFYLQKTVEEIIWMPDIPENRTGPTAARFVDSPFRRQ